MELARKKTHYNIVAGVLFLLAAVCECLVFLTPDGFRLITPWIPPSVLFHLTRLSTFLPAVLSALLAAGMLLCRRKTGKILTIAASIGVIIFSAMLYFLILTRGNVSAFLRAIAMECITFEHYCMILQPVQWVGYLLLAVIAVLFFAPALLKAIGYYGMKYIPSLFSSGRWISLYPKSQWLRYGVWAVIFACFAIVLGVAAMLFAGLALVRPEKAPRVKASPAARSVSPLLAIEEVKKYKGLLDSGVMTQEEYDEKKKQLLGL